MAIPDPSVDDVAALLRARLKVAGGGEEETFTTGTRPTKSQVEKLLGQGRRRVEQSIGSDLCEDAAHLAEDATQAAAIYVAMLIEQSYFPEQTRNAGSSFQSLKSLWDDSIKTLTEAVGDLCGGGGGSSVGGSGARAKATFDDLPLIGRSTPEW